MNDSLSIENFKNASGSWYLKAIFYEMTDSDKSTVLYSLKTEDHKVGNKVYPSLRRLYLEMNDESEYQFAETYFGGWPHWKRLLSCSWFQDYISDIREELAVRNAAKNLLQIRQTRGISKPIVISSSNLGKLKTLPAGRPKQRSVPKLISSSRSLPTSTRISLVFSINRYTHEASEETVG